MGLFDVIKQQGMNLLQKGTESLNNLTGNQQPQQSVPPTPSPSAVSTPPPAPAPSAVSAPPPPVPTPSAMPPTPPNPAPTPSNQGDGIYGNYMENLIDMALADGELTEKEKQVLFKKAEAMGVDLDEFEMVLDARLYEKKKAMQVPQPIAAGAAPKSDKYGDVKKCPACGAMIESFSTRCPDCGYEFRNIESNASVQKLMRLLMEADEKNEGLGATIFGGMLGLQNKVVTRKKTIIGSFPIPTTKDDILEFLTLAVPQAKKQGNFFTKSDPENQAHNDLADAWKRKCEQIIMKARFSMKDDPKTLAEIERYAKELKIS